MAKDFTRILVTINPQLLACVDAVAKKAEVKRSWLIRRILTEWLEANGFDNLGEAAKAEESEDVE
ncbi:hypothetical+protein [Methylocapsa aurea]|uniref:ribbon-helix-helix domain-containing protein n=1 Tax=Methylocapsa aurea TaxID=663610 RepID=UPI003D18D550